MMRMYRGFRHVAALAVVVVVGVVVVTAAVAVSSSDCGSGVVAADSAVHCGYSYFCSKHQPSKGQLF